MAVGILKVKRRRANEFLNFQRHVIRTDARLSGRPANVGIAGCGRQGKVIAAAVRGLPGWHVTDLLDLNPDAAKDLQQLSSEARVHENMASFFRNPVAFDVLAIATTASSHYEVASAALYRGIRAIFLEKPVTNRLADADKLIEMADRTRSVFVVDHTRRFMESLNGLKRILESGMLGSPRAIHFLAGRAAMAMTGTHLFDLTRWLLNADITSVRAELDEQYVDPNHVEGPDDYAGRCEVRLANQRRATMDLSGDLPMRHRFFTVACEDGRVEVDERLGTLRLVGGGGRYWETRYALRGVLDIGIKRALVDLASGRPSRCDLRAGRAALEAVVGCHVSHRRGGSWVDLPLPAEVRDEPFKFA